MGLEESKPEQPLYVLDDQTTVTLQVLALDTGVSLMFGGVTLDAAGSSTVLGTTPDLHADGSWQVTEPGGGASENRTVTLQLTAASSPYTASAPFTITLVPTAAEGE